MNNKEQANIFMDLEDCRQQYKELVGLMPDAILINSGGKFIFANPSAMKLLGANKASDITDRNAFDFFHPEFHEQIKNRVKIVLGGGDVPIAEEKLIRLDGGVVVAQVAAKLFNYQGKPSIIVILHDLTEAKQTQEVYQNMLSNLPIGVYRNTSGPKGTFIEINPAMVRIFEADSKEELMNIPVRELYRTTTDRKKISEKLIKNGIIENEILALRTLKGREIWGSVSAVARLDQRGEVYFDGTFQDVTEVEAAKQRYTQLIEMSPDGVAVFSVDGDILFVNKSGAEIIGAKDSGELIGQPGRPFIHGRSVSIFNSKVADALSKRKKFTETFDMIRLDKEVITIEASGNFIDYEGQPATQVVYRDISEREVINKKLRESEERYRRLVEIIPDAIIIHQNTKIVYANQSAIVLAGAEDPGQVIGKDVLKFVHIESQDLIRQRMASSYKGIKQGPDEVSLVKLDGEVMIAEIRSLPIFFANELAGMVIIQDITLKKRIDEEVAARIAESERLNKLMIGRELKMAELKEEISVLKNKLKA